MDVIVVSHKRGKTWKLGVGAGHWLASIPLALLAVCFVALVYSAGYYSNHSQSVLPDALLQKVSAEIQQQQAALAAAKAESGENTRALARRMAELNTQMVRLNAAGERMVQVAELDPKEFNFGAAPAVGGPEIEEVVADNSHTQDPLLQSIEKLEGQLSDRERQLRVLEDLLQANRVAKQVVPSGWPVNGGFISSLFGYRTDPFTGRGAFHEGIDFAGPEGSSVMAVAAGVVSYAGERSGYGELVEVNHGNGYITRYGHNSEVLVKVGDTIRKGQRLALMGSTGRSTGPHCHFEVLLNGSAVNPAQYVEASR
jgi:murein DD-endopeptidase MepM/ murein hydrolase activator NlpD